MSHNPGKKKVHLYITCLSPDPAMMHFFSEVHNLFIFYICLLLLLFSSIISFRIMHHMRKIRFVVLLVLTSSSFSFSFPVILFYRRVENFLSYFYFKLSGMGKEKREESVMVERGRTLYYIPRNLTSCGSTMKPFIIIIFFFTLLDSCTFFSSLYGVHTVGVRLSPLPCVRKTTTRAQKRHLDKQQSAREGSRTTTTTWIMPRINERNEIERTTEISLSPASLYFSYKWFFFFLF